MTSAHWKQGLIGLIAVGLLAYLFVNTRATGIDDHTRVVEDLRQLRQLDVILNEEVLETRFSLLTNYDPIVASSQELTGLSQQLPGDLHRLYSGRQAHGIDRSLTAYLAVLAQKQTLIEDFKSKNALVKNSLDYLPTLSDTVKSECDRSGGNPRLCAMVTGLLRQTMIYSASSDPEVREQIPTSLQAMEKARPEVPAAALVDWDLLIGHARLIYVERAGLDSLLTSLTTLPTDSGADALSGAYYAQYRQTQQRVAAYGVCLDIYSVVLLLAVAANLYRLSRSARAVREANEGLEVRVAERTRDLAASKEGLDRLIASLKRLMSEVSSNADLVAKQCAVVDGAADASGLGPYGGCHARRYRIR
jgi:hypothetical protein